MLHKKNLLIGLLAMLVCCTFVLFNHTDIFTKETNAQSLYTGKEDHAISLAEASEMTANFRKDAPANYPLGGYFGREAVLQVLNQEGAVGMRYYYANDNSGNPHIVLVGVDANGDDMTDGYLAERASWCPPLCSQPNELNSSLPETDLSANF